MQTFLPYADFAASAAVLDDRRLGKQRVETFQILRALTFPAYAWKSHPAVRMWRGFVPALVAYGLAACAAWTGRGFADTVAKSLIEFSGGVPPDVTRLRVRGQLPPWLGLAALHVSHRSALVRKEPEHYRRFFPDVPDDLPYLWPQSVFPRWPVRRPVGGGLSLLEALAGLGFEAPRPGQTEAVAALRSGRNVLVAMPAGYGGSATGLLAGLMADRPTLWITPTRAGDQDHVDPDDRDRSHPDHWDHGSPAPVVEPLPHARAPRTDAVARPAGSEDLAAVAEEVASQPDFVFLRPADLVDPRTRRFLAELAPGQVVVDDAAVLVPEPSAVGLADEEPPVALADEGGAGARAAEQAAATQLAGPGAGARAAEQAAAVANAVRDLGGPPVLVVTGPADPARRAELTAALGLRTPVCTGGGFDRPATWLGVRLVSTGRARAAMLGHLVAAAPGPGLVVVPDFAAAHRVAAALTRRGRRMAAAEPELRSRRVVAAAPEMPSQRLAAALAAYRAGRLAALVATPALGAEIQATRARTHFVHCAGPPADIDELHAALGLASRRGEPSSAVLLLTAAELAQLATGARPEERALHRYAVARGCRRAVLLDHYGEPVAVPCGGCDRCAPDAGPPALRMPGHQPVDTFRSRSLSGNPS